MNAIIIDDEPIARQGISLLADKIPYLNIIGQFGNPLLAQEFILGNQELDLIFLDVEMPGMTGVEYLKSTPHRCHVILTTAYHQYAVEAFELDVIDYLLKPIRLERFVKAVGKAKELSELTNHDVEIEDHDDIIYIKSDRKYVKLKREEILYIKGLKDYVIIHMADGAKYMTAMNIGTIYSHLDEGSFARVSKSYIINVYFIKSIDLDTILLGDEEIPLGRTYKEHFLKTHVKDKLIKR